MHFSRDFFDCGKRIPFASIGGTSLQMWLCQLALVLVCAVTMKVLRHLNNVELIRYLCCDAATPDTGG